MMSCIMFNMRYIMVNEFIVCEMHIMLGVSG